MNCRWSIGLLMVCAPSFAFAQASVAAAKSRLIVVREMPHSGKPGDR